QLLELALIPVDLAGQGEHFMLERFGAGAGFVRRRGGGREIELENRIAPAAMLANDILDDLHDQRKRAVGLLDSEELHVGKVSNQRRRRCSSMLRSSIWRSSRRRRRRSWAAANRRSSSSVSAISSGTSIGRPFRSTATNVR